ncbi:MAG: hypothetical protein ACYC35_21325 [Pirellulales bacterium]
MPTGSKLNSALLDELRDSVAANRPVEAIKIVHEQLGIGLVAAKALVDNLIRDGLLASKDDSKPLISFSVPRSRLWVCRLGGGLMILFAVVTAILLLIQGASLILLGIIPIIAFGWTYGRFSNRPEVEFYADRVNYKTLTSRRSIRFEDVSSMALSPQGSGIHRALVLFVKDVANWLHPICVPNVFEQGRSIIQYLEAFTGLKCIAMQTPREHKQWRSEKVAMKVDASAP